MYSLFLIAAVAALFSICSAVPTKPELEKRQLGGVLSAISSAVAGVQTDAAEAASAISAILGVLEAVVPTATPTSIPGKRGLIQSHRRRN